MLALISKTKYWQFNMLLLESLIDSVQKSIKDIPELFKTKPLYKALSIFIVICFCLAFCFSMVSFVILMFTLAPPLAILSMLYVAFHTSIFYGILCLVLLFSIIVTITELN